jgi:hypothetical protein
MIRHPLRRVKVATAFLLVPPLQFAPYRPHAIVTGQALNNLKRLDDMLIVILEALQAILSPERFWIRRRRAICPDAL